MSFNSLHSTVEKPEEILDCQCGEDSGCDASPMIEMEEIGESEGIDMRI